MKRNVRRVVTQIFFASKKDALYSFVIWGSIFLILIAILPLTGTLSVPNVIGRLLGLTMVVLLIWVWFNTGYRIENESITIQSGPFKQRINVQEITKISKKKSVWSAAALSTDRLVIKYGKYNWEVLVSPKKENEFIQLLVTMNSKIQLDKIG